ncbi:MAG: ShlB/FhaC/HecB family hemolysin secretion/activation protein [Novosphingobium sp.]
MLWGSLVAGGATPAWAQAQGDTPPALPGTTREVVNPPPPERDPRGSQVSVDSRAALERAPCPLDASDVRTTITEVRFSGPDDKPLAPELAMVLAGVRSPGGEQPVRVVCDIRDQANQALRDARYVAAVRIPPQRIDDGVLRLSVVSARIVETRVRGDAGPYKDLLEGRIRTLEALDPFNEGEAERILLLADDVPGLEIRLALQPKVDGRPGEVIGEIAVDYMRARLLANVQNYNSRQLGRETAYLLGEYYGLTGMGDRTFTAISTTFDFQEQKIFQLGHELLLDPSGLGFGLRGTYAISKPELDTLALRTESYIASGEFTYPLMRGLRENLEAGVGFEHIDQRTTVGGGTEPVPLNLDRISAVYYRLAGDARYEKPIGFLARQAYRLTLEVRQGLDIFKATREGAGRGGFQPSRFEGDSVATIIRGGFDAAFGFSRALELAGTVRGQWASRALLNYDEFSLGNLTVGRGYDPGSNTGDRAFAVSVEPRVNLSLSPSFETQLFGFYDGVRLWNLDPSSTEKDRRLESVGGGVRLTLPGRARLEVTYAHPLDPPLLTGTFNRRPPDRVLVSLTTQLLPWGARR